MRTPTHQRPGLVLAGRPGYEPSVKGRRPFMLAPGRAAVADVFSQPHAVEAGVETIDKAT